MNRNTKLAIAALLMVVLGAGGLFVGYKGYKKFQAKQNQEFRYEGKITIARAGIEADAIKQGMLSEALLNKIVAHHNLVSVWGLDSPEAAKEKIRQKFGVKVVGLEATLTYQDKNKELAKTMLETIVNQGRSITPAKSPPAETPPAKAP